MSRAAAEARRLARGERLVFSGHHPKRRGITDCFSLMVHLWETAGHRFPSWPRYRIPAGFWRTSQFRVEGFYDFFHEYLSRHCVFIPAFSGEPGDVLGFKMRDRTVHLAMVMDDPLYLAAFTVSSGVTVSPRSSNRMYLNSIHGAYRPRDW